MCRAAARLAVGYCILWLQPVPHRRGAAICFFLSPHFC